MCVSVWFLFHFNFSLLFFLFSKPFYQSQFEKRIAEYAKRTSNQEMINKGFAERLAKTEQAVEQAMAELKEAINAIKRDNADIQRLEARYAETHEDWNEVGHGYLIFFIFLKIYIYLKKKRQSCLTTTTITI